MPDGTTDAGGDRLRKLLALLEKEPGDAFCLYGVAQEHARAGRAIRGVKREGDARH